MPNDFEALWRQHEKPLLRLCMRALGNQDAARDALSRIAIQVWLRFPLYARAERRWGLLRKTAIHVCIDIQRQLRRQERQWAELDEHSAEPQETAPVPQAQDVAFPGAGIEERQLVELVQGMLAELPASMRDCARMAFMEQQDYLEIAEALSLSPVNVRKNIERSRQRLIKPLVKAGVIDSENGFLTWLKGRRRKPR
jgi:RNA polymerase sigma-70 factor, ECF subfamily